MSHTNLFFVNLGRLVMLHIAQNISLTVVEQSDKGSTDASDVSM